MRAYVIVCGQWGSTGKGLIAGYLSLKRNPDTVVCNFGPNAGHTFITPNGDSLIMKQLPTGLISPSVKNVLIGPGAIIDPDVFVAEIAQFHHFLFHKKVMIHPGAVIVRPKHKLIEKEVLARISSTQKGAGAALVDKIMRVPGALARDNSIDLLNLVVTHDQYMEILLGSNVVQVESAQGMELSVGCGSSYPYCTSRDITVSQILADCLIHPSRLSDVIATMRTYPIRVGHQYNVNGEKIGDSGPVYADQRELSWDDIGVPSEKTTVTGKIRRVFTWSNINLKKVIRLIEPNSIFLNFVNYISPDATNYDELNDKAIGMIQSINHVCDELGSQARIRWIGLGPRANNVHELPINEWGRL